jgi:hypothetical protein
MVASDQQEAVVQGLWMIREPRDGNFTAFSTFVKTAAAESASVHPVLRANCFTHGRLEHSVFNNTSITILPTDEGTTTVSHLFRHKAQDILATLQNVVRHAAA